MGWVFLVFRLGAARGAEVWVSRASRAGVIRKEYVDLGVDGVGRGSDDILVVNDVTVVGEKGTLAELRVQLSDRKR